jgi:hypothetical protein
MARSRLLVAVAAIAAVGALGPGCSTGDPAAPAGPPESAVSQEQLYDPRFCASCHPTQYGEWATSMHAYASDDPLFRAMNQRAQRETGGALGTFCAQCHAPLAVRLGRTKNGLDLDATPRLKGVGCYFCHTVESVTDTHNNPLVLSASPVFRAAIHDPETRGAHAAEYSSLLDGTNDGSSGTCGSCHDIVTPAGAHIERTFREWAQSRFGVGEQRKTPCGSCHMPAREGLAAEVPGARQRTIHDHSMAGVDLALTPFPGQPHQRAAVQALLDDALDAKLCVSAQGAGAVVDVRLANTRVGHGFPSGSNQDRRAWVELEAWRGDSLVFESGRIPQGAAVSSFDDGSLFLLRDHDYDEANEETELFWKAARFTSAQLPAQETSNPSDPAFDNGVLRTYSLPAMPDRVTMQVNVRPVDATLVEELVASGDLDPASIADIPTFSLASTRLTWTAAAPGGCVP